MFGISDTGCVRDNNEDRFLIDRRLGLCLLADGLGGHEHGEVAADLAVRTSHHFLSTSKDRFDVTWPFGYDWHRSLEENRLVNAVQLANRQVWSTIKRHPKYTGMGSTLLVVTLEEGRSVIGSVGDTRAYLFRDGCMRQLTEDDSWVGDMVKKGALSPQAARSHSMRNVLTQALGTLGDLDVHTSEHLLFNQDMLLLATDGIYGVIEPKILQSILALNEGVQSIAEHLVETARHAGAPDNATCIVLRYLQETHA